jgi:hypothetical protein
MPRGYPPARWRHARRRDISGIGKPRQRPVGGREYPELTDEEMARIAGLDTGGTLFFDPHDPEWVIWLATRRVD